METNNLQLATIKSSDGFHALRDEWDSLCIRGGSNHFFQSFDWCWLMWRETASKRRHRLHLVIGRLNGRLVLVWPMMVDGRTLRMLSSDTLEYRDVIVDNHPESHEWLSEAWRYAAGSKGLDICLLQNVRQPGNIAHVKNLGKNVKTLTDWQCPIIDFRNISSWDDYASHLSKSLLNDQRRQWKRAREILPDLEFKVIDDIKEAKQTIDWALKHKGLWLLERKKYAKHFLSEEMRSFLLSVSDNALPKGRMMIAQLADGDAIISAGFGYYHNGDFLFHVFAYDEQWQRLSPSRLFLEMLIRWCIDKKTKYI